MGFIVQEQLTSIFGIDAQTLRAWRRQLGLVGARSPDRTYTMGEALVLSVAWHLRRQKVLPISELKPYSKRLLEICNAVHPLRVPNQLIAFFEPDQVALYRLKNPGPIAPLHTVPLRELAGRLLVWIMFSEDSYWLRRKDSQAEHQAFIASLYQYSVKRATPMDELLLSPKLLAEAGGDDYEEDIDLADAAV